MNINFVTAKDGKIELHAEHVVVASSCSSEELAKEMEYHGLADSGVYHSSSMDFASEDGFANDGDAWEIFDDAIKIYNWNVNGIAG